LKLFIEEGIANIEMSSLVIALWAAIQVSIFRKRASVHMLE